MTVRLSGGVIPFGLIPFHLTKSAHVPFRLTKSAYVPFRLIFFFLLWIFWLGQGSKG